MNEIERLPAASSQAREGAPQPPLGADVGRPQLFSTIDPCADCGVREQTLCGALQPEEMARMAAITQRVRFKAHEPIFGEGEPAAHVYNVTGGMVKIYKLLPDGRRQITGFLGVGDFLGMAIGDTYAYSAEAITEARLCRFQRSKLEALLIAMPQLQRRLFVMASTELCAAQDQMLLLGRKTARERLCSFLLYLSQRAVRSGQKPSPVLMPMTRADIADYLGLTTETVSRTLTQLKSRGLIALLPGGKVRLNDPEALGLSAGVM
ncbi:MAG: helix-turn-helix domain-containing protein [Rhodospirillaceae bacterium]|nr:helix-turn-helix domain-containing protein [Rhodospirillaceae bacterium]